MERLGHAFRHVAGGFNLFAAVMGTRGRNRQSLAGPLAHARMCALENAQERDQVRFLLRRENKAKAALVKLHRIQQSPSGPVMEVRGAG